MKGSVIVTPLQVLTICVSLISLIVSICAAYKAYSLAANQLLFNNRNEFHKLLIEHNKQLIADPTLWGIYDDHAMAAMNKDDPVKTAKLHAFAYMTINTFELVHAFYNHPKRVSSADGESWVAWDNFMNHTIRRSSLIRSLLQRKDIQEYYAQSFINYVNACLAKSAPATAGNKLTI
jgi:hypothetical protein